MPGTPRRDHVDPTLDLRPVYPRPEPPGPGSCGSRRTGPGRGAAGAALGYTGGGPLVVLPAAVAGSYPATGRDIYGEARITRDILGLRAAVEPGNSGGPLVLEDGAVGGLVFAESQTSPDVGYALTPSAVANRIAPAIGSRGAVDLGQCIR